MTALRHTLRSVADLADAGLVAETDQADLQPVAERYAVAVTPAMAALIERGVASDPIALQFVPQARELTSDPAERSDPIGDHDRSPVAGVVHRYPDRVLLKIVGICPVYCRFCFRREMVGPEAGRTLTSEEIAAALAYIAAHKEIWEVILTGGDPFMLSARRMGEIGTALAAIPHVKVLRWHTRVPVVAPERVTDEVVAALRSARAVVYVSIHANHPRELTPTCRGALARIADAGIPLLSQTVLLKGVNDDPDTLEALMRSLVEARVTPYYLHHCDLAPGTSHFRTSLEAGQALMRELHCRLSGLAMPTYVIDIPGGYGKVPAGAAHVKPQGADGAVLLTDARGQAHAYPGGVHRDGEPR